METEIPSMLHARARIRPERFTFHASRMRMHKVTNEELSPVSGGVTKRMGRSSEEP
jgi:maleate isomerase